MINENQLRLTKHLWVFCKKDTHCQETLKIEIGARKYKDVSLSLRETYINTSASDLFPR